MAFTGPRHDPNGLRREEISSSRYSHQNSHTCAIPLEFECNKHRTEWKRTRTRTDDANTNENGTDRLSCVDAARADNDHENDERTDSIAFATGAIAAAAILTLSGHGRSWLRCRRICTDSAEAALHCIAEQFDLQLEDPAALGRSPYHIVSATGSASSAT